MKTTGCMVCKIVLMITAIGAINWGLAGIFQIDLVSRVFGVMTIASKVVYGIIGVTGLMILVTFVKPCPCCCKEKCETKAA